MSNISNLNADFYAGQLAYRDQSGNPIGVIAAVGNGLPQTIRTRFTIAQINAGATLLAALPGYKYRIIDATMIAIGGNASGATTVDLLATQSASGVKLIAAAVAGLTRSALLTMGATNSTVLADGSSNVANDANTAITVGKTGADVATSTHVDFIVTFVVEKA